MKLFPLLKSSIILTGILIAGCSRGLFSIHTIDIQQGNALDAEDVSKIQTGMSRENVKQILGSPVLTPVFNPDRWDYVYYLKKPDTKAEKQRISVFFSDGRVTNAEWHSAGVEHKKGGHRPSSSEVSQ